MIRPVSRSLPLAAARSGPPAWRAAAHWGRCAAPPRPRYSRSTRRAAQRWRSPRVAPLCHLAARLGLGSPPLAAAVFLARPRPSAPAWALAQAATRNGKFLPGDATGVPREATPAGRSRRGLTGAERDSNRGPSSARVRELTGPTTAPPRPGECRAVVSSAVAQVTCFGRSACARAGQASPTGSVDAQIA